MNRRRTALNDDCLIGGAAAALSGPAPPTSTAGNTTEIRSRLAFDVARAPGGGVDIKSRSKVVVRGRGNSGPPAATGKGEGSRRKAAGVGGYEMKGDEDEAEVEEEGDDAAISCIVSSYAGFSKKGFAPFNPRKHNQDALIMAEDATTGSLFFAVMDGHGEVGEKVAQAFRRGLFPAVLDHPAWEESPETAVAESISALEQALLDDSSIDTSMSGTTLVSVCVRGNKLVLTNVGDSRATLGRRRAMAKGEGHRGEGAAQAGGCSLVAQALTEDHKPDHPVEKERIMRAGGRVFSLQYSDGVDGPPRVWLKHVDVPGLAMSRTLGDVVAHTVGVVSDPDTYRCDLDNQFGAGGMGSGTDAALLILATDGLWEFVSNQEAVDIASRCSEPREAVQQLTHEATKRWMKEEQVVDDITVCVAFLNDWNADGAAAS